MRDVTSVEGKRDDDVIPRASGGCRFFLLRRSSRCLCSSVERSDTPPEGPVSDSAVLSSGEAEAGTAMGGMTVFVVRVVDCGVGGSTFSAGTPRVPPARNGMREPTEREGTHGRTEENERK